MAEAKASTQQPGDTGGVTASGNAAPPTQDKTPSLRLVPVNNSDHPVVANTSSIHRAPGMAYIDFGFFEPGVLAALPRIARQGASMREEIVEETSHA